MSELYIYGTHLWYIYTRIQIDFRLVQFQFGKEYFHICIARWLKGRGFESHTLQSLNQASICSVQSRQVLQILQL
jgi:hypothetical protein